MDRPKLNKTETRIVAAIESYVALNGYSPAQREVADLVGVSLTLVRFYYVRLVAKGYIAVTPKVARGVTILHGNPSDQGQADAIHREVAAAVVQLPK